ncbi:unnamed protein product [Leptosia nina]|uniref:Uncharacterized protein n=1 Tax=Leptosia nina TaxID=320188 RepID=A0AAV1JZ70_9NEOP
MDNRMSVSIILLMVHVSGILARNRPYIPSFFESIPLVPTGRRHFDIFNENAQKILANLGLKREHTTHVPYETNVITYNVLNKRINTQDELNSKVAIEDVQENNIDDSSKTTVEDVFSETTTETDASTTFISTADQTTTENYEGGIEERISLPAQAVASLLG